MTGNLENTEVQRSGVVDRGDGESPILLLAEVGDDMDRVVVIKRDASKRTVVAGYRSRVV